MPRLVHLDRTALPGLRAAQCAAMPRTIAQQAMLHHYQQRRRR